MRKKRFAIILTALKIASTPSLSRSSSNGSPKLLTHTHTLMEQQQHGKALRALSIYLKRALLPWCVELLSWKPWKLTQNHKYFKQNPFPPAGWKSKSCCERATEMRRPLPQLTVMMGALTDGMLKDWPFCCMVRLLKFRHFALHFKRHLQTSEWAKIYIHTITVQPSAYEIQIIP